MVCVHAKLLQSCLTLCSSMDHRLAGSFVSGILQSRMLEWVVMPSSRGSSWGIKPMSFASPSLVGRFFTTSATWEAQLIWYVTLINFQMLNILLISVPYLHLIVALIFYYSYVSPVEYEPDEGRYCIYNRFLTFRREIFVDPEISESLCKMPLRKRREKQIG